MNYASLTGRSINSKRYIVGTLSLPNSGKGYKSTVEKRDSVGVIIGGADVFHSISYHHTISDMAIVKYAGGYRPGRFV